MVQRLSEWILARRRALLAGLILATGVFLFGISRLQIVTDFESFFLPGDPNLVSYEALKRSFGSDEFVLIAYEAEQGVVFSEKALRELRLITAGLSRVDRVREVVSLTNAREFVATSDGIPVGRSILGGTDPRPADIDEARRKIAANPFYRGLLVSTDESTAFLVVQMQAEAGAGNQARLEMTRAVEQVVGPYDQGNIRVAGTPIYLTELYRLIIDNLLWLGSASALIVVLLLWLSLRSVRGVVLPLGILLLSVLWNMGIFGLAGAPITIASSVVIPLIVAISVTSSIHFLLVYTGLLQDGLKPQDSLLQAMTHIIPPAFYSTLTTSLGFLTLITAEVLPVVQTGLYTACGVMASFLLTITVIPIALSYFPDEPVKRQVTRTDTPEPDPLLVRALDRVANLNLRHPLPLILLWVVVAGAGVVGIGMIRIETNPLKFFREGSKMAETHAYFEKELGGTLPFDVLVEGPPGAFKDLRAYDNLRRFEEFLKAQPELHGVIGLPDLVREVNYALTGERSLPYNLQEFGTQVRLIDLARSRYPLVSRFVDVDWSQARFTSRVQAMSSEELSWLIRKIDRYAEQNLDERFDYEVTGIVKLLANMIDKVADSQIASLTFAVGILWVCFIVFLRSFTLGTVAMVPNVIPIIGTLGLMGALGIDLDLATVMMPSIAIGLAVDDTLHFFNAFRHQAKLGTNGEDAIRWTLHFRGRAFFYTSLVLVSGFGILLGSTLRPVADFGIISCAAILLSLLADLLLNPALLRLVRPRLARWESRA